MTTPPSLGGRRVLLVDTLSGGNDYGVELAVALSQRVNLTVFTVDGSPLRLHTGMRVITGFPRYGGGGSRLAKSVRAAWGTARLACALWRHRRGVVHVQFMRFPRLESVLYSMLGPWLPHLVITAHNVLPHEARPWHRAAFTRWYRLADRVHVLSRHVGQRLVEDFGVSPGRIVYIPHGNYQRFVDRNADALLAGGVGDAFDIPGAAVVVGSFGLIRPYKGVGQLARAFIAVSNPNAFLVIGGSVETDAEPEMRDVRTLLAGHPRVRLIERFLGDAELAWLLTRSDVVAFPYTTISQSGALMLAMTYGKAVVANDVEGFREYLRDGETGILCNTQEVGRFADAIDQLVASVETRRRLGAQAKREMDTTYSWGAIADGLVSCYRASLRL